MSSVESWGTGRPDYSDNVEFATVPLIRSHQTRSHLTISDYLYYALDWPYTIGQVLNASVYDDTYTGYDLYETQYTMYTNSLSIESDSNTFCLIGLIRYRNYGAYLAGEHEIEYFGYAAGYGKAELIFDKGVYYDPVNKYVDIFFSSVAGDNGYPSLPRGWPPDYVRMTITTHQVEEKIRGPLINK